MYVACPRCTQQNYPNATQCAYCGAPLGPSQVPAQPFAATNAPGFASGTGAGAGPSTGVVSSQPQVGQLIDRKYQVERILGEGGMGIVYVAHDINADQKVVIKAIRPEFASRADFRERTLSEGKAMAKIDHQNVVRFYSIINHVETNELYIVMQFIEGESLDRTLEKAAAAGQRLPIAEVIRVFKQILDGVGAAHKEGLIHRDLKPANVLVRAKDGVAKVMDFGIAKAEGATKGPTQVGGIVGSLWYMAPEQIKGARDLDTRLDIYALGIVLFELITGSVPFDADTEFAIMTEHMSNPVPSVLTRRPDAPPWIDQVIAHATQKERDQRYQTCAEFRAAIDALDGGIQVPQAMTYEGQMAAPMHRASGGGTAVMGPVTGGGMAPPMMAPQMMAPPIGMPPPSLGSQRQSGGGSGVVIGIVVVLLLAGGGAGAYFAFGRDDGGKKDEGKTASADEPKDKGDKDKGDKDKGDKDKGDKAKDDKGDKDKGETKAPPPKKKNPLDALVGEWKSVTSGRVLNGVKVGDEIEFRIADGSKWEGAYSTDEVRVKMSTGSDDKTFSVTELYRAVPTAGVTYSPTALATCTKSFTAVKGQPLEAKLTADDMLEVSIATYENNAADMTRDGAKISNCGAAPYKATSIIQMKLKKQ